jgi:ParB-like chromosome segregation protein Spo0J
MFLKVKVEEIVIGDRRREEMGDIQGLADSIKEFGLLHPVVIDDQKRLVAGGRRLEACKRLGWEEIEVTSLGELSEKQIRAIELEENLRRKDLTEYEKSRNMVQLAEIKAEIQKEEAKEFRPPSGQNLENGNSDKDELRPPSGQNLKNANSGGRPAEPGSIRSVAKEMGIAPQTLHEAKQHVQAVEKYPELKELPKKETIQTAKKLDQLPQPTRLEVVKKIAETKEVPPEVKGDISFMFEPGYEPPVERVKRDPVVRLRNVIYQFQILFNSVTKWHGMETAVKDNDYEDLVYVSNNLTSMIEVMNQWKAIVSAEIKNNGKIRRIK